ncbi:MAG: ornithine cyclodeaminase [Hoeflea sp.]|uniref:ornithine cyclodeaminase family protein n=1 Tax=Hoeflea sp. TaxID=1940281 RepID=UPI001D9886A5|nr:ornithine cyclodeaminase [Hoeflea sp.]MBU4528450.1 ornithine cyclodeaminase [Alphaproteobacteria bacterium]MBU4543119.1 ornithine cyclodeaminase [Alphaproteobacteria bacterium]MBU4551810.1 ornithine cyclodeaminase [Alphaproteobacteria bacterium]MBV1723705.1 ornithine cyclodeaminase [Hoeflea sp.]MBV1762021.1 ornithine cyclodeaminase [Hoeflea sp.]
MRIVTGDDISSVCSWPFAVEALRAGHLLPPADLRDSLVENSGRKMLVRTAWIPGLASGVKAVTIYPDNPSAQPPRPSVQGQVLLFDEAQGHVVAVLEGVDLTAWKTAGDSALGSSCLSRMDIRTMLMLGAGSMARPLIDAHRTVRPSLDHVMIWNRSAARAEELAAALEADGVSAEVVADLDAAVSRADLISSATMSTEPLIRGAALKPGTHVDLVGAYTPTMREADDATLQRGRLFVDSFATTIGHIGEVMIPMASGAIAQADIKGDLHDLVQGRAGRKSAEEITVFKNGGGAHLDVMIAHAVYLALEGR